MYDIKKIQKVIVHLYFLSIGVIPFKKYKRYQTSLAVLIVSAHIAFITGMTVACWSTKDWKIMLLQLMCMIGSYSFAIIAICSRLQYDILEKVGDELLYKSEIKCPAMKKLQYIQKQEQILQTVAFVLVISPLASFIGPVTTWITMYCTTETTINYNDPGLQTIPKFLQFWEIRSVWQFLILSLSQFTIVVFAAVPFICYCLLISFVTYNLQFQYEYIGTRLNAIVDNDKECHEICNSAIDMHEQLHSEFRDLIQYVEELHR